MIKRKPLIHRPKLVIAALLCVSFICSLVIYLIIYGEDFQKKRIINILAAIPDVSSVEITGFYEELGYTVEEIHIELNNSPARVLVLSYPDVELHKYFRVRQIGETELTYCNKTKNYVNHPNFGELGSFAPLLEISIDGVSDLINHYDEILKVVSSWPEYPEIETLVSRNSGDLIEYWRYPARTDKFKQAKHP